MLHAPARISLFAVAAVVLLTAAAPARAQSESDRAKLDALAEYQQKLAAYKRARSAYEREHDAYWDMISQKRRARFAKRRQHQTIALADYVLTHPPLYAGPPWPKSPLPVPPTPPKPPPELPVVADFLEAAKKEWSFVPEQPESDAEFKRAYARAARAAGLTLAQVIGVYAFETGGRGSYDTQAGVTATRKRAISPAMGYNQLLSTNSVSLLAEHGKEFMATLNRKGRTLTGNARANYERKLAILKRMIDFTLTFPHSWSVYDKVAKETPKGWGIHAILLDIDIGPILQVQKLLNSVHFARIKGFKGTLTPAELELMNLTGDGNGIDMVLMPQDFREKVPTSNFFQPNGYARNPIASRTKVVAGLVAEIQRHMDRNASTPGARELAAAYQNGG
jgi:hypothetical protein